MLLFSNKDQVEIERNINEIYMLQVTFEKVNTNFSLITDLVYYLHVNNMFCY